MQPEPLQTSANPLGTAPIGKLLPKFAIPSVIAFLVSSPLYNLRFTLEYSRFHRIS